jgi:hypothetical protein
MGINQRVITSGTLSGANSADAARVVWPYAEKGYLEAAYIENALAVTADGSNNITVSATINATSVFSRSTASSNLTQGVEAQTLGASMVGEKKEVASGDTISIDVAEAGTGPAYDLRVTLVFNLIN